MNNNETDKNLHTDDEKELLTETNGEDIEMTETDETTDDEITEAEEITADKNTSKPKETEEVSQKKKDSKIKRLFKSRKLRKGSFSIMFIAVFVAVVIVLNMVASLLTEKIPALTFDFSTTKTTQLSQDTIDFLQTIKKEVTITVLADENQYTSANEYYLMANTVLKQYHNQNNKITVKYIDLTANPTFVSKYPDDTLSGGNYIVECGDKHRPPLLDPAAVRWRNRAVV